jgi:dienelactone hydrolase
MRTFGIVAPRIALAAWAACLAIAGGAQTSDSAQRVFNENVSESDHFRAEQAKELDGYIRMLAGDKSRLRAIFTPDYSSPKAFVASANKLRKKFADAIGYPPPGSAGIEPSTFVQMGEDDFGVYFRAMIPILPGVHAEGIYIVPKGIHGRVPLVVSMHGGGGSPEVALFHGGANYHDMVRGAVKRGYAVFAPQHLFNAPGFPGDIRNRTDDRLRLVGTSLTAVEIAKITRSLDVLVKRPEVDSKRIAMVGLSYGGYYALVVPALEPRIKVAVSSCYFGVQEYRYALDELGVPSDFRFMDRFSLLRDSEIGALICPRPLLIQAGKTDDGPHREMGIRLAPEVADYYQRLGKGDSFQFLVFDGGHEFDDRSAWDFLGRFL